MQNIRKPKNAIKLARPASWWASTWREALPTGNGRVGASVFGGAGDDTILITHSDLWWQGHVGVIPDVSDKLTQVRKSIDNQSFREAESILSGALITKGYRPQLAYPLPICALRVTMPIERGVRDYSRTLNTENGEISVSFRDNMTRIDRSLFVARDSDLICYEITKTGSRALEVTLSLDLHERFNARTPTAVSKLPDGVNVKYENFFMYFSARSDSALDYGCVAKITFYGGSQVVTNNGITIRDAERILVVIKPFVESTREREWKALRAELSAVKLTYDKLIREHATAHVRLLHAAELDLEGADRDTCADVLLDRAQIGGDGPAALLEKLFAYGRFLALAASAPGARPIPPYGIWCGDYKAIDSQLTAQSLTNQYAHLLDGNLPDYLNSMFAYYESVVEELRKNASRLYGCRGIFVPELMAHGTGVPGTVDNTLVNFTAVGGMLARLFYDYYLHTLDTAFLKNRALPFMREVAAFYEDFFKIRGDSLYESSPSYSPGSTPANFLGGGTDTLDIARNATIDFAVARELLQNLVTASEIAGMYPADVPKWKDMISRIPPMQFNPDNTVREYCDARLVDNMASPSTAVFYPVYPGLEVTPDKPELVRAFLATARKRYAASVKGASSMSLLRYAAIFARLGDGNTAYDILTSVIKAMSMNNLILATNDWRGMGLGRDNIWATYTTQSNALICAVLQEMLVQSTPDTIRILPALPDALPKGSISSLLTRTGAEVSIEWDRKKSAYDIKLKSRRATRINLVFPDGVKRVRAVNSERIDYATRTITDLELPSGKNVLLEMR